MQQSKTYQGRMPLLRKYLNKCKKVIKAIWDDMSSSLDNGTSNEEMVNLYIFAKDDIEVTTLDNVSIENISHEKLQNAIEELDEELEKLGKKYVSLKKKISYLTSESDVLRKENIFLENENHQLKKKVTYLEKDCWKFY